MNAQSHKQTNEVHCIRVRQGGDLIDPNRIIRVHHQMSFHRNWNRLSRFIDRLYRQKVTIAF